MELKEIVETRLRKDWPIFVKAFMKRVRRDMGKSSLTVEDVQEIIGIIDRFDPSKMPEEVNLE
jgi:RecB family exonuclease